MAKAKWIGYGDIWLAEDYFDLGCVASVAPALASHRVVFQLVVVSPAPS